ncbi:MAG: antitoxin VapB family protein [Candidatus Woesearchaeota archaeon]
MVKLVSLSNDVYDLLKSMKKENESFSQLLRRRITLRKKVSLLDLAGSIKDGSFDKAMVAVLSKRNVRSKEILRFD